MLVKYVVEVEAVEVRRRLCKTIIHEINDKRNRVLVLLRVNRTKPIISLTFGANANIYSLCIDKPSSPLLLAGLNQQIETIHVIPRQATFKSSPVYKLLEVYYIPEIV